MKIKRFLGLVLKLAMVLSLMPMIAWAEASQSTIGTYSIFDVIIPFENAVDCQRTTEKTIGKLQQVNQFNYVCAASDNGIRINKLDLEVTSNPQNYYYRFSRSENYEGTIALTLYKYDDSTYSYLVSDNGYIQSYGENCFIYDSDGYGTFVSFRDKEYHMCDSHAEHKENYSYENSSDFTGWRADCILCGCGEAFIIQGYNPSIKNLEALPWNGGLVAIEGFILDVNVQNGAYTFPAATEGTDPEALTVTVQNTDNKATGDLSITLSGTDANAFILSTNKVDSIAVGGTSTFTVTPKANLGADTYTATVTVGAGDQAKDFNVEFTVTPDTTVYTINVEIEGNGTAEASPVSAIKGTEITLKATPNSGYKFDRWEVTPDTVSIGTDNTFTMPAENVSVKAYFKRIPSSSRNEEKKPEYPAKVDENANLENGSISFDKTRTEDGRTVTITVTPDAGFVLDNLVILDDNGNEVSFVDNGDGTYTFIMPVGGVEVDPFFSAVAEEKEELKLVLYIDEKAYLLDNSPLVNDVAPVIREDRTVLPIRLVAETLGAKVEWSQTAQTVTITREDTTIVIYIDQEFALVNGEPVKLDVPAFITSGRTYLPVRFVAETLNASVSWDAATQSVTIIG